MKKLLIGSAILSAFLCANFANAQTTQGNLNQNQSQETQVSENLENEMKEFMARATEGIELPKETAAKFSSLIITPPVGVTEDTTGVNLNGFIRYVPHNEKNYVQAVMTSVSRGNIEIPLNDQKAVNGQFETDKLSLDTTDDMPLKARPEVLNDALKKLVKAEAEAEAQGLDEKSDDSEPQQVSTDGSANSQGAAAGTGVGESNFQPTAQADFDDPKSEIKIVTDGCPVRVDKAQNKAIQQNKTVTYEDGKEISSTSCEDSLTSYTLQKSFDGCSDIVDVASLTVFRQSKSYYNKDGSQVTVSSCAKDTASTFTIVEEFSGCAPVVNSDVRKVTVYSKLVYTGATNAQTNVRACSPSTTQPAYDLQQSYESCTYKVDLSAKQANARYKDYYVNHLSVRTEVSDCTVDSGKQWTIVEREGTCKVYIDFSTDNERVFKQSVMEFTDDKGVLNEARGCDKSTLTKPVAMIKDTNLCSIRHDYDKKQSHQMFIWKYTLDNVAYQASACADTEVAYPHKNYTLDAAGAKVCSAMIDQTAKLVTLFYRTGIVVAENVQYITECKPDTTNKLTIISTTDSCTDPASWQHDLAASISYENIRWYYTLNGKREYVTPCQKGTKTYMHDQTTVGWQLHDDKLYALPISKVVIDAPIGQYVVSVNTVLNGAVQQPYVLQETKDIIPDGNNTPNSYEGCTGLFTTVKTEIYKRPDGSIFNKNIGTGDSVKEAVCLEKTVKEKWIWTSLQARESVIIGGVPASENGVYNGHGQSHWVLYSTRSRFLKIEKNNKYTNTLVNTEFRKIETKLTRHSDIVINSGTVNSLTFSGAKNIINNFNAESINDYPSINNSCQLNSYFLGSNCNIDIVKNSVLFVGTPESSVSF